MLPSLLDAGAVAVVVVVIVFRAGFRISAYSTTSAPFLPASILSPSGEEEDEEEEAAEAETRIKSSGLA